MMKTALAVIKRVFTMADRDGDGKLFKKELETYNRQQADAIASRIVLTYADRGQTLFAILDRNGDQKLGLRELRRAGERLARLDGDGDGRIAQEEIPRGYRLTIGRGPLRVRPGVVVEKVGFGESPAGTRGATWFERMDRNRDGDVSRREFLGSRAQFERFDRDGDGLIDAKEAAARP
jgi:Ca2+-binding EF-hand superfamily protein